MAEAIHADNDQHTHDNPTHAPHHDDRIMGEEASSGSFAPTVANIPVVPSTSPGGSRKRAGSHQQSLPKAARVHGSKDVWLLNHYLQNVAKPPPASAIAWAETSVAMLDAIHEGILDIRRGHMGEGEQDATGVSGAWAEAIRSVSRHIQTLVNDSRMYPPTQSTSYALPDDPMGESSTLPGLAASIHAPSQASPLPVTTHTADSAVMEVLKEMKGEMRAMRGEVSSLRNRLSAVERPSTTSPTSKPSQTRPTSYAATAATNVSKTHINTASPPPPSSPSSPSKKADTSKKPDAPKPPVEIVVAFGESKLPPEARRAPEAIVEEINREFHQKPTSTDLTVLGAQWTMTGNCKLSFLPGTDTKKVCSPAHLDIIRKAASNGRNVIIEPNAKWSKFAVNNVLVHDSDNQVFSEETLDAALRLNPFFTDPKVRIMQKPRFTKKADEITGNRSSVSFAILDPDGSLGRRLLKTPLFMFGRPVTIREWRDKPQLTQCKRCWVLGHTISNCREKDACRECGSKSHHTTTDHRRKCQKCQGADASIPCSHFCCVNCKGGHVADSPDCPTRRKYHVPVAEPSRMQISMDVA
jgi:hypothetical protein